MTRESLEPVRARSSRRLQCSPQTLSSWASSVLTHSLFLMVQSFTSPSEPLSLGLGGDSASRPVSQLAPTPALSPAPSPGQQLCATAHEGHLQHRGIVSFECLHGWNGKGVRWHQVGARPGVRAAYLEAAEVL